MKKTKKKRWAISVRFLHGQRMAAYCAQHDISVSSFVETTTKAALDRLGQPEETIARPRVWNKAKTGPKPKSTEKAGGVQLW